MYFVFCIQKKEYYFNFAIDFVISYKK